MRSREEYCANSRHYAVFYSRGHQCGGIGINYQTHTYTQNTHTHNTHTHTQNTHTHNTHAQLYVHTTLFNCVRTISVVGRLLAVGPSRDTRCLHFAVLTCTCNCFLIVHKVVMLALKKNINLARWVGYSVASTTDLYNKSDVSSNAAALDALRVQRLCEL